MRYYVVSDIHGFCTELITTLKEKGFFADTQPHKLVICGDLFDRGRQALQLQKFILELIEEDQVILIRGNHEDLFVDLLANWDKASYLHGYHNSNGTLDTVLQLTNSTFVELLEKKSEIYTKAKNSPFVNKILPLMKDYFETNNFIFVHGWIPCNQIQLYPYAKTHNRLVNWRNATKEQWDLARWTNGMEAAHDGIIEHSKTIVCGHWHTSFGHSFYEKKCSEFGADADFTPYYSKGIIAIDACTAHTRKINCLIIED